MKFILFNNLEEGKPLSCFKVGLLGCTSIESIAHGKDSGNISIYSYRVNFKNLPSLEIKDTVYVSD